MICFHPRRRNASSRHAMTLIEVLAVVVILGLIAGTLAVGFSSAFGKGKHELARSGIAQIVAKLELYRLEHDAFPASDAGLAALTDGAASPACTYYLEPDRLLDPWGRPFLYSCPGPTGHPYEVLTYGVDNQPGGDGENEDISSTALRARRRDP